MCYSAIPLETKAKTSYEFWQKDPEIYRGGVMVSLTAQASMECNREDLLLIWKGHKFHGLTHSIARQLWQKIKRLSTAIKRA
jgi:hypothetical protein